MPPCQWLQGAGSTTCGNDEEGTGSESGLAITHHSHFALRPQTPSPFPHFYWPRLCWSGSNFFFSVCSDDEEPKMAAPLPTTAGAGSTAGGNDGEGWIPA